MLSHAGVVGAAGVAAGGGAGPDTWYYSSGWALATTPAGDALWDNDQYIYGEPITIAQSGTVTFLSMFVGANSGTTMTYKFALYNVSGNLVASGTSSSILSGPTHWVDIAVSQAVAAGSYSLFCSSSDNQGMRGYLTGSAGKSGTAAYAAMPVATLPTLGDEADHRWGARVYVD